MSLFNKVVGRKLLKYQKQPLKMFCKKNVFKDFRIFTKKTPVLQSFFNKVAVLRTCNFIKEDSDTSTICEMSEMFKNNYFEEHLSMSASKLYLRVQ